MNCAWIAHKIGWYSLNIRIIRESCLFKSANIRTRPQLSAKARFSVPEIFELHKILVADDIRYTSARYRNTSVIFAMLPIHLRNTSVIHPWLFFTYPHYSQNIRQDFTSLTFLRGHPQWHPLFRSIPLRMTTNAGISRKIVSSSVIFAIYIILVRDIDVIGKLCIHLHTQYIHSQSATLPSRNYP